MLFNNLVVFRRLLNLSLMLLILIESILCETLALVRVLQITQEIGISAAAGTCFWAVSDGDIFQNHLGQRFYLQLTSIVTNLG